MILKESVKGTATTQATYVGVNVKDPTHEAKKNSDLLDKLTDKETQQLAGQTTGVPGPNLTANSRYDVEGDAKWLCWRNLIYRYFLIHYLYAWHSSRDLL